MRLEVEAAPSAIELASVSVSFPSTTTALRLPSLALVVSPKSSRPIISIADLRGATVGVTSPGSSTDFFLKYLLVRHGLAADGLRAEFGVDNYAASVLYSSSEWLTANAGTARKLASAIVRTLRWIDQHSATEIADRMPPEHTVGNREVYIAAIERMKESFSKDGVIRSDGAQTAYTVLSRFNTGVAEAKIDLGRTYTNDYLPR
ncbi:hypothetical protein [Lentzea kentuckyensis]|uniref:hypothetical protein n=1 Tax=Lentzea kentuckyensis TaxID=360086 RepID=UPI00117AFB10|nr:hypothetical protein [Lentzea kentuckyensis]